MKKLFVLFVISVFALGLSAPALAQTQATDNATGENILETSAGMLPDSPFYGLKKFGEGIQLFFTFDQIEKAKLKYKLAQLRLAEAEIMARLDKLQHAENALKDYENRLADVEADEKAISAAGRNASAIADLVGNSTYRHILVLQKVYEKVPESAKPAIMRVMENSMERHSKMAESAGQADKEFVNITIAAGNRTITREVPARLAEKFLDSARELKERLMEEVRIENKDMLKERIAEKIEITKGKAEEQIKEVREMLANTEGDITADANITALARITNEAKTRMNAAEAAFGQGNYREAYNHAIAAEKALMVAESIVSGAENIEKIAAEKLDIRKDKAQEQIVDAKKQINITEQKIANIANAAAGRLLNQARERISKAEQTFNNAKYGEAFGQAVAAEMVARNAVNLLVAEITKQQDMSEKIINIRTKNQICAAVITPAMKDGECTEFPTSCLPEGWEKVGKCTSKENSGNN